MPIEHDDASGLAALFTGDVLPAETRATILAAGATHVPQLLRLLVDPRLRRPDAPGGGLAPIHAAELLAELGAVEAIEPMLEVLARTKNTDWLHSRVVVLLAQLGARVVDPVIAAHDATTDRALRDSHCDVLARCGARDERIRTRLEAAWEHWPDFAILLMTSYDDAALLPFIERTFARCVANGAEVDLDALMSTGRALAHFGALTDAQRETIAELYLRATGGALVDGRPEMTSALVGIGDAPEELTAGPERLLAYAELLAAAWNFELFARIGKVEEARRALDRYGGRGDGVTIGRRVLGMIELKRARFPDDPRFIAAVGVEGEALAVEWVSLGEGRGD